MIHIPETNYRYPVDITGTVQKYYFLGDGSGFEMRLVLELGNTGNKRPAPATLKVGVQFNKDFSPH